MSKAPSLPVVYSPKSALSDLPALASGMKHDLWNSRNLAWHLILRNFHARNRRSFMWLFWMFFPVLSTTAALTIAAKTKFLNVGSTYLPYPVYVLFSMALWQTFTESFNGPVQAMVSARALRARVNFPSETMIWVQLGEMTMNFGIKLVLIIASFIWFRVPVGPAVLLFPLAWAALVLFGLSIGLLLSPFRVLSPDFSRIISVGLQALILATPVIYPIPDSGWARHLILLNPVTSLLITARELGYGGPVSFGFLALGISLLLPPLFLAGWMVYRISMPLLVERAGA